MVRRGSLHSRDFDRYISGAPLGMGKGVAAIIIGHVIGCALLFMAGLIGAKSERSAMETVKMSFGAKGSLLFSILNILQLVGWTAIMIISGARAAATIFPNDNVISTTWFWCLVIGGLILVWIAIGIKNLGPINVVAHGWFVHPHHYFKHSGVSIRLRRVPQ